MEERVVSSNDTDWDDDLRVTFQDELYTGTVETRDESGRLLETQQYAYGVSEGVDRRYYASGQIEAEIFMSVGFPVGTGRTWHENGQLKSEFVYQRARIVHRKRWDSEGNLTEEY
jgi:antitoxin component YwqK of YwqJK toxin-antitoxin module